MAAACGPGPLCLQSAPGSHFRRKSRRACRHFPTGSGPGAHHRHTPEALRLVPAFGEDAAGLLRAIVDEQRRILRLPNPGEEFAGRIGSAGRVAANALRQGQRSDLAEQIDLAKTAALARDAGPLLSVLDETFAALGTDLSTGDGEPAAAPEQAGSQTDQAQRPSSRSLRVDESKIDALFNLAGELIVAAKNGFAYLARRVGEEFGEHELARDVRREHDAIERLIGEMHAAILQLRMVPRDSFVRSRASCATWRSGSKESQAGHAWRGNPSPTRQS